MARFHVGLLDLFLKHFFGVLFCAISLYFRVFYCFVRFLLILLAFFWCLFERLSLIIENNYFLFVFCNYFFLRLLLFLRRFRFFALFFVERSLLSNRVCKCVRCRIRHSSWFFFFFFACEYNEFCYFFNGVYFLKGNW